MTTKWEKQEDNKGVLTFEVSAEEFDQALDQAFKKVSKDVQIPGFRKGKIPRSIFEKRFGVESLYQDAVDIVLPGAYSAAVDEANIFPIAQPSIDIDQIEKGQPLVFTAEVEVKPEAKLGEYKGLEVEEQSVEVTDEDVEQEIENLRERHAELVVKEDEEIEEGDTAVIDFEGFKDGEPFEGGKDENHSLEIGSGQFIPGFEEQLIGKKAGDETEVPITFPEEYHAEDLAGQEAVFKVKIHEVKAKELPELDDEFAKDVDEDVETLDELKTKKREELEANKKQQAENEKREALVQQVTDNVEVDVPKAMVDTEVDQMYREFEQQLQMQGMTMEMYSQFSGQDENALKEQMREDAEKRVKTNLALEAIVEAEDLKASQEDIDAELEKMSSMYGVEKEQLVQMLGGSTEMLENDLKTRAAIDFLVEHSTTK
ncbi:trigger factor [Oceanobacillus timonensis]|uniref:trigger factor n=1 Tax=Oceanobacillus timonensis TaxID=1926285 RepID=UPI0009BA2A67|nr:trigger factor [Oceanobacillus timonensis]